MTSHSGGARKGGGRHDPPKKGVGVTSKVEGGKDSQKRRTCGLASSPSNLPTIPGHLSFYVRIEHLSPNYDPIHGEPRHHSVGTYWVPPNTPNGLANGQDPAIWFHWRGGTITIQPHDPFQGPGVNRTVYRAATVFTQYPDTPHLLAVPFNARTRSVNQFGRRWQCMTFNHIPVGNSNSYYSYISDRGGQQRIAAPGSQHWMDQLLPDWYNCNDVEDSRRTQAGLIGELPLLFALAAFSAPPASQGSLRHSIAPGRWIPHHQNTGRDIAERGMVVTIYLDPHNPTWSTSDLLNRLQNGEYGPFYGPQ